MEIRYSKSAQKAIAKYDAPTKRRIKDGIDKLLSDPPEGDIKPLQGFSDGRCRLRIGKYRIIFRFDEDGSIKILLILDVDSRGGVYK